MEILTYYLNAGSITLNNSFKIYNQSLLVGRNYQINIKVNLLN